jgi:multidrug resistance efflux pump
MALKSVRRPLAIVAIAVIALGFSAAVVYLLKAPRPAPPPILGIVHKTEIRIAPEISARMTSYRVTAGQKVRKGDILTVLSSPELTAAVEEAKANVASARADKANVDAGVRKEEVDTAAQDVRIAEANLALAQVQHTRSAILAAKDFATKQQLDETTASLSKAEASLKEVQAVHAEDTTGPTQEERAIAKAKVTYAEAALADIEAKLAKATLTAPVDGVVSLLIAEPGEAISPGQPVMTLEAANDRWFTMTVREDSLSGITVGSPLRLLTAKGDRIEAKVTELRPLGEFAVWRAARAVGDHDLDSFLVRADPTAGPLSLEPGMTVWIDRGPVN